MAYGDMLEIAANWAAILTALVATLAYLRFVGAQWRRRRALEAHLREEKRSNRDNGRRTLMHLMANLAMTEAEVLHAGFQSRKITVAPGVDEQGRAARLYFAYSGEDVPVPQRFSAKTLHEAHVGFKSDLGVLADVCFWRRAADTSRSRRRGPSRNPTLRRRRQQ